jgi:hypothetical protein
MMTMTLLAVAATCLAFAGFCWFGLPYMIAGPRVLDQLRGRLTDKALLGRPGDCGDFAGLGA